MLVETRHARVDGTAWHLDTRGSEPHFPRASPSGFWLPKQAVACQNLADEPACPRNRCPLPTGILIPLLAKSASTSAPSQPAVVVLLSGRGCLAGVWPTPQLRRGTRALRGRPASDPYRSPGALVFSALPFCVAL